MELFADHIKEIRNIDVNALVKSILDDEDFQRWIVDANKQQMTEGLNIDGNFFMRYVDDPYFKSREKAIAYQNWKSKISKSKSKPKEVMDFFINGYFHNSLDVQFNSDSFELNSNAYFENSIQSKTNDKALGLTQNKNLETLKQMLQLRIYELLWKKIQV